MTNAPTHERVWLGLIWGWAISAVLWTVFLLVAVIVGVVVA